jgi:hypothetical protein
MGEGQESDRPDQSGFVMDGVNNPAAGVVLLTLWEVSPGASNSPRCQAVINEHVNAGGKAWIRQTPRSLGDKIRFPPYTPPEVMNAFVRTLRTWAATQPHE